MSDLENISDSNTTQTIVEEISQGPQDFKEPITKKDPKRVEQGKRLALISKQAKEKKMRERIEMEMAEEENRRRKNSWLSKLNPYMVGGVSLFLALYTYQFGIPFKKSSDEEEEIVMTKRKKVVFEDPPESPKSPKKKFEGFD